MASTGTQTSFANLNQWVANDRPQMNDFNEDNQKIDSALATLSDSVGRLSGDMGGLTEQVAAVQQNVDTLSESMNGFTA